jgi:inhibitor of KinA sporulation pathway (predicted exonuclease)
MGAWLQKNRNAPHFDEVVAPFIRTIRSTDPEAAAAWAETIRDPEIKKSVLSTLSQ